MSQAYKPYCPVLRPDQMDEAREILKHGCGVGIDYARGAQFRASAIKPVVVALANYFEQLRNTEVGMAEIHQQMLAAGWDYHHGEYTWNKDTEPCPITAPVQPSSPMTVVTVTD